MVSTEYCLIQLQVPICPVPSTKMSRSVPKCPVPSTEMSKSVLKCLGFFCDESCIHANAPDLSWNISNFDPLPNYRDSCWILAEFQNFSGIYLSLIIGCPQTPCQIISGIKSKKCWQVWMLVHNENRKNVFANIILSKS